MTTLRGAWKSVRAEATAQPWTGFLAYADYLVPGTWVAVPPRGTVWYHVDAEMPRSLTADGGKAAAAPAVTFKTRRQWAKRTAYQAVMRLAGIRRRVTVSVPDSEPRRGNAIAVVKARARYHRAEMIVLEPESGRALRLAKPGTYDDAYIEVRSRFQRYLPAPGFSVSDDGAVLAEQWYDGQVLSGLPVERQVAIALEVLERLANLVAHETVDGRRTSWESLPRLLDEVPMLPHVRVLLAHPKVRRLLNSGLLVPGQGDQTTTNIIVEQDGAGWQVIDFDGAGWVPVWWDPVVLVLKLLRRDRELSEGKRHSLHGALNRVLAAACLDEAAGLRRQHMEALAAVRDAWIDSARATPWVQKGFVEPNPDAFAYFLHQRASHASGIAEARRPKRWVRR